MALSISDRLIEARNLRGLTQDELANLVGVNVRTISAWEKGENFPQDRHLQNLANILRVSITWLRTGLGPMQSREDDTMQMTGTAVEPPPLPRAGILRNGTETMDVSMELLTGAIHLADQLEEHTGTNLSGEEKAQLVWKILRYCLEKHLDDPKQIPLGDLLSA